MVDISDVSAATGGLSLDDNGAPTQKKYDTIVIGGGAVGSCFARDMAAMGYTALVIEEHEQCGGTWRRHNYPGLKLHMSGHKLFTSRT